MNASTEHRRGQLIPFDFVVAQRIQPPEEKKAAPAPQAPAKSQSPRAEPPRAPAAAYPSSGFYELTDLHDALRRIEAALLNERTQNRKLQDELAQTLAQHQHEKRVYEDRARTAQQNEQEMRASYAPLQASEAALRRKVAELTAYSQRAYAALQNQKQAGAEEVKRLQFELNLAHTSHASLQEHAQELEHTLHGLRAHAEQMRREAVEQQSRLQTAKSELQRLHGVEAQVRSLREQLRTSDAEHEELTRTLQERLRVSEAQREELTRVRGRLEAEQERLRRACAEEKHNRQKLEQELETERTDKHELMASLERQASLERHRRSEKAARPAPKEPAPASLTSDGPRIDFQSLSQQEAEKLCEQYIIGLPGTIV